MSSHQISKPKLLQASLRKQDSLLSDFEQEIKLLKEEITGSKEMPSQDQKSTTSSNELLVRLEHELLFLKKERLVLQELDGMEGCEEVKLGAVVVTDQRIFYVSASLETIELEGTTFFGISVHAPIYAVMKGNKPGDIFSFGGIRYTILEIY